jgi:hypothetical protein
VAKPDAGGFGGTEAANRAAHLADLQEQPMADSSDETGKKNARPGEPSAPKRPFATLDLKATEVEGERQAAPPGEAKPTASASPEDKAESKPEAKPAAQGPKDSGDAKGAAKAGAAAASLLARRAGSPLLTHLGAGAVGALIVLGLTYVLAPTPQPTPARAPEVGELTRRMTELEGVLGTRPGTAGLRARVDELSRSLTALGNAQAKLAREAKGLEDRIGSGKDAPSELAARIAKLEQTITSAAVAADPSAQAPPSAAMAAKLAEIEKAAQAASDAAKSAADRMASELATVRTEAGRLGRRLDGIKGEVDERMQGSARSSDVAPITKRLAALEQELKGYVKDEAGRRADAGRVVLALELAALRRAVDRGDSYAAELAAVQSAAGDTLDLAPLERHMREGVLPAREIAKSFRQVANAMLDAEADRSDATLVERLVSSARSIVRVRKTGHAADDASAEAVIGRMETALKEGRLAEVIEQGKRLPPKAALAAEEWLGRVEARHSVDRAMAGVEATLKSALGPDRAGGPEPKR